MKRASIRAFLLTLTYREPAVRYLWSFLLGLLLSIQLGGAIAGYLRHLVLQLPMDLLLLLPLRLAAHSLAWILSRGDGGRPEWWHVLCLVSYACRFVLFLAAVDRTTRVIAHAQLKSRKSVGILPWVVAIGIPALSLTYNDWSPTVRDRVERMWAEAVFEDRWAWSAYLAGVPVVITALGPFLAAASGLSAAAFFIAGWVTFEERRSPRPTHRDILWGCFILAVWFIPPDLILLSPGLFLLGWPSLLLAHRLFRIGKDDVRELHGFVGGACASLFLLAVSPLVFGPKDFEVPPYARDRYHLARAAAILAGTDEGDRVIAGLVRQIGPGNNPDIAKRASIALQSIGASAERVLPKLFQVFLTTDRDHLFCLLTTFDAIDPDWANRPEAQVLVQGLADFLADVSWADGKDEKEWWDTPKFRDVEVFTHRGEQLLNETFEGGVALRALAALNDIDPGWRGTPDGRRAIERLIAEQRPDLIEAMKKWIAEMTYPGHVRILDDDERRRASEAWGAAPLGRLHAADALLRHINQGGPAVTWPRG